MITLVRLVTVHPALVHVTLGGVVLAALFYVVGMFRSSERWTFAADVTLWVTTVWTIATGMFGLVSNFTLVWPRELEAWRWAHLALGVTTLLLLLGLSYGRARAWQLAPSRAIVGGSVVTAAVALIAGWIGGEVLVFHGGMAVRAAGEGALSPPTTLSDPKDLPGAMDRLRAHYTSAQVEVDQMLVSAPDRDAFSDLGLQADRLVWLGRWLSDHPLRDETAEVKQARLDHAKDLSDRALALRNAADAEDLGAAVEAMGDLGQTCVDCHEKVRWKPRESTTAQR